MALGLFGGALLGGAGSAIGAAQSRKDQTRFRRRQRKAIADARSFAGGTTVQRGFDTGFNLADDTVLPNGQGTNDFTFVNATTGERQIGGRVDEILSDPLLQSARGFLQGTFDNAADSPLAQDFRKGIQQAQSARGTFFGGAAVNAEAAGLGAFSQRLRQDLLPQALQFGQLGEQLRQSVLGFEAPLRTAAATGGGGLGDSRGLVGPSILGEAISGAAGGAAAGFNLQREFFPGEQAEPEIAQDGLSTRILNLLGIG
jgi:hypothetical protein